MFLPKTLFKLGPKYVSGLRQVLVEGRAIMWYSRSLYPLWHQGFVPGYWVFLGCCLTFHKECSGKSFICLPGNRFLLGHIYLKPSCGHSSSLFLPGIFSGPQQIAMWLLCLLFLNPVTQTSDAPDFDLTDLSGFHLHTQFSRSRLSFRCMDCSRIWSLEKTVPSI